MTARLRSWMVASLAAAALGAAGPVVAQQIPVRVGGSTSSFVGVQFDVPIEVDLSARSEKLGSFALTLRWNPSVLNLLGGNNGNFGDIKTNDDSIGLGVLKFVGVNPAGVGGRVVIGVGHFVPLAAANDTIRLNVTELYAAGSFADLLPSATWSNRAYCPAVGRFGDIDGDEAANSRDALLALSYSVGTPIPGNPGMGDVDGDGGTGARDALIILSNAVGLDVTAFRVLLVAPGACAAPRRPVLSVLPGGVTFDIGQHAQFSAWASDSTGGTLAVTDLFWKSSNDAVATVSPEGVVTAVGPGTAAISATRQGGASASATVAVLQRRTHWVDAFAAPDVENQLGAPELPFHTIGQALDYARPGDTVRVRSARYDENLMVTKPVVMMGDTAGGRARPLIAAPSDMALEVTTRGRVELHAFRFDTTSTAIEVQQADTMLVRWVEFRHSGSDYSASLYVHNTPVLLVQRSAFFGPGAFSYVGNAVTVTGAALVAIDSTYIGEYGDDAVDLYGVDSVFVRGSTIRYNNGYGVYSCAYCDGGRASSAVFSGNRFTQNYYGHVYLDWSRSASFDHNRTVGGGYDGIEVNGDTTTNVTFLGDSLETLTYGSPIALYGYDSLMVDSTVILGRAGYSYLYDGRFVSVRHSKFLELTGDALDIYSASFDTTHVLLRDVEFRGPDESACDRCADLVYGGTLSVDADTITAVNFYEGFYLNSSRLALRRATLEHYWYGVEVDCGSVNVAGSSFRGGEYGIELYGCGAGDSLVVDNSTFADHADEAIYAGVSAAATIVSNSQFTNNYTAISQSCGQLRVINVTATGGYYGVDGSGCSGTDTLRVDQSSFTQFYYGAYLYSGTAQVSNSSFTDDDYGMYLYYSQALVTGNQVLRPRNTAIYHYWYSGAFGTSQVLTNTVACDAYGATNATGVYFYRPFPGSDTVTITGNDVSGCNTGIDVYGGRRTYVRNNTIALPTSLVAYKGIGVDSDSSTDVVGNAVSGFGGSGSIRVEAVLSARVDSNTVTNAVAAGLWFPSYHDSLRVRDNTINGVAYTCCSSSAAIQLNGASGSDRLAEVQRNRMTRVTNGILLQRGFGDTLTVRLDSNTVRDADSMGIWVRNYSKARIRFNALDSAGLDAVRIDGYLAAPAAVLDSNNFTRSQHFAVRNLTGYTVDASDNWWGDATGPACDTTCGSGDSVSTLVSFVPFLTAPFTTFSPAPRLIAAAPFAPSRAAAVAPAAGSVRVWEPRSAGAPQHERTRTARAGFAPVSERATGPRAERLRLRHAERAQLWQQQEARRTAREQARAEKQQARAVQEARRQAPEAPRRPQ